MVRRHSSCLKGPGFKSCKLLNWLKQEQVVLGKKTLLTAHALGCKGPTPKKVMVGKRLTYKTSIMFY